MKPYASVLVLISGPQRLLNEALAAFLSGMVGFTCINGLQTETAPDLILLAYPEVNSLKEIITRTLQEHPGSKVLFLSRDWTPQQAQVSLQAGAIGCLDSQLSSADFASALRQASRGEIVLSDDLQRAIVFEMLGDSSTQASADFGALSGREEEVLTLLCDGLNNKQIAQRLYLSVRTVENHLRGMYQKLGVTSRTEAAVLAMQQGWVPRD